MDVANKDILFFLILLAVVAYQVCLHIKVTECSVTKFLVENNFHTLAKLSRESATQLGAIDVAKEALRVAQGNEIELQAIKKSTHTVIPVGGTKEVQDLERRFREATGMPNEDFDTDLEKLGFATPPTNSFENPEDLV